MPPNFTWFIHTIMPKNLLTRIGGFVANIKISFIKNSIIWLFIRYYKVAMQEAVEEDFRQYHCFNDFFIRLLKPSLRPLATASFVSPVDGVVSAKSSIAEGQLIQAKGHSYTVNALLGDDAFSSYFKSGAFATFYLSPKDYHRVHMPVSGELVKMLYIPGKLFSVGPKTTEVIPNLFARNERIVAFFKTEYGLMAMILVGATIVGSIGTVWEGSIPRSTTVFTKEYNNIMLNKGDEMGYFKLGSTVILLLEGTANIKCFTSISTGCDIRVKQALCD